MTLTSAARLPHLLLALFSLCHGALSLAAGNPDATGAAQPAFQFSTTSSEPLIEFNLVHHMLAQPDPTPLLRVYGNGRVHVHYPAYMKKAGEYEMYLNRGQIIELLRMLSDNGIMDFNEAAIKAERRQLETARRNATGEIFHISDDSDTHIDIRLKQFQRAGTSRPINNFTKQFRWRNLKSDVARYPGSASITKAANATATLEALCKHPALQRLP